MYKTWLRIFFSLGAVLGRCAYEPEIILKPSIRILFKSYPTQTVSSERIDYVIPITYPHFKIFSEYFSDMPLSRYSKVVFDVFTLTGGAVLRTK